MKEVYIVGAKRTPIGSFLGSLKDVHVSELGAFSIKGALEDAQLKGENVDLVVMGNVLQAGAGQAPARQAMRKAGIPDSTPAVTVNKVCGSGMFSIITGAWAIRNGDAEIVVAGGMESMSNAPYASFNMRSGARMGNAEMIDLMIYDGLWDPYENIHMGNCGEICAEKYSISRKEQDDFAIESYKRALRAMEDGTFRKEIIPVKYRDKKGNEIVISEDEEPGRVNFEKIPHLKPAFKKDGTITPANASSINDGAAAVVLAGEEGIKKYGLKAKARLIAHSFHAQEPKWFTTAPIESIKKILSKTRLKLEDIDLIEINEAFAVVPLVAMKVLGISHEKLNIYGGAVSLGHPIGASGARIVVTLMNAMENRNARLGLASICIGGGEAISTLWEKVS